MELLVTEFDKRRFPHIYSMQVDANSAVLIRGCLERAAENLGIKMHYAFQHINERETDHHLGGFLFGIAVERESDYGQLMDAMDTLVHETKAGSELTQGGYDAADAEMLASYRARLSKAQTPRLERDMEWEID